MRVTRHDGPVAEMRHRYAVGGWGVGELVVRDGRLAANALPSRRRRPSPDAGGPPGGTSAPEVTVVPEPSRDSTDFVPDLCLRLAAHLGGTAVAYDDIPVDEHGLSTFQRELLAAARSVGWGEIVTYGELAARAGRPRAARAAGSFCARNRWALVVPCHRIVAAGANEPYELGGYGPGGDALKRRLLALEGTLL